VGSRVCFDNSWESVRLFSLTGEGLIDTTHRSAFRLFLCASFVSSQVWSFIPFCLYFLKGQYLLQPFTVALRAFRNLLCTGKADGYLEQKGILYCIWAAFLSPKPHSTHRLYRGQDWLSHLFCRPYPYHPCNAAAGSACPLLLFLFERTHVR